MRDSIIVVCSVETNEYFISPKHDDFDLPHFVPSIHYFPVKVGRYDQIDLNTAEDVVRFFYPENEGYKNITNREDIQKMFMMKH